MATSTVGITAEILTHTHYFNHYTYCDTFRHSQTLDPIEFNFCFVLFYCAEERSLPLV